MDGVDAKVGLHFTVHCNYSNLQKEIIGYSVDADVGSLWQVSGIIVHFEVLFLETF